MLRILYFLAVILAALAYYLSAWDRTSVMALTVVEWEGVIGMPLHRVLAAVGVLLFVVSELPQIFSRLLRPPKKRLVGRPAETRAAQNRSPQPMARQDSEQGGGLDWLDETIARAQSLSWESQAQLRTNPRNVTPFVLVLKRATSEQVRRAVSDFGAFLATIPLPRRVRVDLDGCMVPRELRVAEVSGALKIHLAPELFRVVGQEDCVDVLFTRPDPRWTKEAGGG